MSQISISLSLILVLCNALMTAGSALSAESDDLDQSVNATRDRLLDEAFDAIVERRYQAAAHVLQELEAKLTANELTPRDRITATQYGELLLMRCTMAYEQIKLSNSYLGLYQNGVQIRTMIESFRKGRSLLVTHWENAIHDDDVVQYAETQVLHAAIKRLLRAPPARLKKMPHQFIAYLAVASRDAGLFVEGYSYDDAIDCYDLSIRLSDTMSQCVKRETDFWINSQLLSLNRKAILLSNCGENRLAMAAQDESAKLLSRLPYNPYESAVHEMNSASFMSWIDVANADHHLQLAENHIQRLDTSIKENIANQHNLQSSLLHLRAVCASEKGETNEAVRLAERRINEAMDTQSASDAQLRPMWSNYAVYLIEAERFDDAVTAVKTSLELGNKVFPKDQFPNGHRKLSSTYSIAAQIMWRIGRLQEAKHYAQTANAMLEALFGSNSIPNPRLIDSRMQLVKSIASLGEHDQALSLAQQSMEQFDEFMSTIAFQAPTGDAQRYALDWQEARDSVLMLSLLRHNDPKLVYERILHHKGILFRAARRRLELSNQKSMEPLKLKLRAILKETNYLLQASPNNHRDRIAVLFEEYRRVVFELSGAERNQFKKLSLESIQNVLDSETCFVDFYRVRGPMLHDQYEYIAFVVTKSDVSVLRLGEARQIDSGIDRFLEEIATRKSGEATDLVRSLWKPLNDKVKGQPSKVKRLLICTEGAFDRCPFDAIPSVVKGGYLIHEYDSIEFLRSPSSLIEATNNAVINQGSQILLVGNTSQLSTPELSRIESTTKRSKPGVTVRKLEKQYASLTSVVYAMEDRNDMLYIAAHMSSKLMNSSMRSESAGGAILSWNPTDSPERSILQLQRGDVRRQEHEGLLRNFGVFTTSILLNDGVLDGATISEMKLGKALTLAVFAGCESNQPSQVTDSNGDYKNRICDSSSLAYAMHLAGAERTVASMWSVDSLMTEFIMGEFFQELCKGAEPGKALVNAKRHLIRNGNSSDCNLPIHFAAWKLLR